MARDEPGDLVGNAEASEEPEETADADIGGEEAGRVVCETVVGRLAGAEPA